MIFRMPKAITAVPLVVWLTALSIALPCMQILCVWLKVSSIPSNQRLASALASTAVLGEFLFMQALLIGLMAFPVAAIVHRFVRWQRRGFLPMLGVVSLWATVLFFVMPGISWKIRRPAFQRASERAEPLVKAIDEYAAENSRLPPFLETLTPKYIAVIPNTGLLAHPRFNYEIIGKRADGRFDYRIFILCGEGLNFDEFFYLSSQDYAGRRDDYERIGKWCYYHE